MTDMLPAPQNFIYRINYKLSQIWIALSWVQRVYLIALCLLPVSLGLSCFLTLVGLVYEFWPRFVACWHSLAGKAVLLLFYAVVANFGLAFTAGVVNDVVGVSAEHFNYTHNAAILLYVPLWLFGMSLIALVLLQLILPLYLIVLLLLKTVGVHGPRLLSKVSYPTLTTLGRFVLAATLLVQTISWMENDGDDEFDWQKDETVKSLVVDPAAAKALVAELDAAAKIDAIKESIKDAKKDSDDDFNLNIEGVNIDFGKDSYSGAVQKLVAHFAYFVEADEFSRCEKTEAGHVVELNDYEILEITPDKSQPLQYRFEVKACISPAFPRAKKTP